MIGRLMKNLTVTALPMSNIIHIDYLDTSPELAQKVVAVLTDCYLKRHVQIYRFPGTLKFFEEKTKELEAGDGYKKYVEGGE